MLKVLQDVASGHKIIDIITINLLTTYIMQIAIKVEGILELILHKHKMISTRVVIVEEPPATCQFSACYFQQFTLLAGVIFYLVQIIAHNSVSVSLDLHPIRCIIYL